MASLAPVPPFYVGTHGILIHGSTTLDHSLIQAIGRPLALNQIYPVSMYGIFSHTGDFPTVKSQDLDRSWL